MSLSCRSTIKQLQSPLAIRFVVKICFIAWIAKWDSWRAGYESNSSSLMTMCFLVLRGTTIPHAAMLLMVHSIRFGDIYAGCSINCVPTKNGSSMDIISYEFLHIQFFWWSINGLPTSQGTLPPDPPSWGSQRLGCILDVVHRQVQQVDAAVTCASKWSTWISPWWGFFGSPELSTWFYAPITQLRFLNPLFCFAVCGGG